MVLPLSRSHAYGVSVSSSKEVEEKLAEVLESIDFVPTEAMRAAKAAFWAVAMDTPLVDPQNITLAAALQLTGVTQLRRWWASPGFSAWWANKDELRQRIEFLVHKGLDAIEEVLADAETPATAKVRAFEILARLADKEPAKVKEIKFADASIQSMSAAQLTRFLEKMGYAKKALEEPTVGSEHVEEEQTATSERVG
jgi:hypothetical protein